MEGIAMRYKIYGQPPQAADDAPLCIKATTNDPYMAAMIVSLLGKGASVRLYRDHVLWTEGEDAHAGDSYDDAADVIMRKDYPKRWIADVNTGNSSKRWRGRWQDDGSKVLNEFGTQTLFVLGAREAEEIERMHRIFLEEEQES
jgi:hypothetical protein